MAKEDLQNLTENKTKFLRSTSDYCLFGQISDANRLMLKKYN